MVDVLGHLGMALLFLAPAWFYFDRTKTAAAFVGVFFWFGMLPDVDLYLSNWFSGIHHHGVFHTVLVVSILAVVLGPLVGWAFEKVADSASRGSPSTRYNALVVGIAGVWVTGIAHLFADMLSAPDVSTPIEPLWPLYNGQLVSVDVLWYKSFWATWALLFAGLAVNGVLWYTRRE